MNKMTNQPHSPAATAQGRRRACRLPSARVGVKAVPASPTARAGRRPPLKPEAALDSYISINADGSRRRLRQGRHGPGSTTHRPDRGRGARPAARARYRCAWATPPHRQHGRRRRLDRHEGRRHRRCASPRPKRAACWSRWRPRSSAFRPSELTVTDGVVSVPADPAKNVSYGELIGGRHFDVELEWNKQHRQRRSTRRARPSRSRRANTRSSARAARRAATSRRRCSARSNTWWTSRCPACCTGA